MSQNLQENSINEIIFEIQIDIIQLQQHTILQKSIHSVQNNLNIHFPSIETKFRSNNLASQLSFRKKI